MREKHIALRRGRQYLREVSSSGEDQDFYFPQPIADELKWVVAWSRIFADREYLCAINTDAERELEVWATVDSSLHPPGENAMTCLLSSMPGQAGVEAAPHARNGSAIQISVPPAGFVIYH